MIELSKIQVFWEGHKSWCNLLLNFDVKIVNFCGILKIYELQGNIQKDFGSWNKVAPKNKSFVQEV